MRAHIELVSIVIWVLIGTFLNIYQHFVQKLDE